MNLLLMSLFCSAVLPLSGSTVCLPTWSVILGVYSNGGDFAQSVTELQYCLAACERTDSCLAIDFDQQYSAKPSCWLHNSADQLTGNNFRNETFNPNKAQYLIHRNCSDSLDEDSVVEWDRLLNTSSSNGVNVDYWTEYDCFTFCRYRIDCVAVDFDASKAPPCYMHTDPHDLNPANVYTTEDVVQYRLNKTTVASDIKQVGRCIGQWFPNTTWCQPQAVIQIQSVWFKDNPLCSIRNADDADPPDASWLQNVLVQYLDTSYYNEIQSCNGMSQCFLRSKCPFSTTYDEPCPPIVIETNFVSISYTCFFNGSTTIMPIRSTPVRPLTQSSSTAQSSTAQSSTTQSSTAQSSTEQPPDASNVGTESRNNNKDIIIGVVVGLGAPLVLITIIIIAVVVIKQRRNKKEAIAAKDNGVFYNYGQSTVKYGNSTVQRGIYPDNEINEISMNVDTM